jgi:hypothetical protein
VLFLIGQPALSSQARAACSTTLSANGGAISDVKPPAPMDPRERYKGRPRSQRGERLGASNRGSLWAV